jgi:hypothetical protein
MSYDRENPDEYHKYWQNKENRKNSALYPFTEEYEEQHIN